MPFLSGYTKRKLITISHARVDTNLTDFPLRVAITADAQIGADIDAGGLNVRFTLSDGTTELDYERESFAVVGGDATGIFWVRIPTLNGASDTTIYVYYKAASPVDGEDESGTWGASYLFRQHATITAPQDVGDIPDTVRAVELWFNADNTGGDRRLYFTAGDNNMVVSGSSPNMRLDSWFSENVNENSIANVSTGVWHYTAHTVIDGGNERLYLDGSLFDFKAAVGLPSSGNTWLGSIDGSVHNFSGSIREVRFSTTSHTTAWIKFVWWNYTNSELTFGSEESDSTFVEMAGTIVAASTAAGKLDGQPILVGALIALTTAAAKLDSQPALAGAAAVLSAAAGTMVADRGLAGLIASMSQVSGLLVSDVSLSGALAAISQVNGILQQGGLRPDRISQPLNHEALTPGLLEAELVYED